MKKTILTALFVIVFLLSCATPKFLPPEERKLVKIIEVNKSKSELYELCLKWMARTFNSPDDVIHYKNKEEGVIIVKGFIVIAYNLGIQGDTYFTLTIEIKDNKVRATFEDIYKVIYMGSKKGNPSPLDNEFTMSKFKLRADGLISDLEKYSNSPGGSDNW